MLKVNDIEVTYSDVILVLRGVYLQIAPGQIIALLGANGAGKTTTLKAVSGLLKAELGKITTGSVELNDKRIDHLHAESIARLGILQALEGHRMYSHLTVEENLIMGGYILPSMGKVQSKFEVVYNYFPRLKDLRNKVSGYLSGGECQMLVIGRALMGEPQYMLLDEPSLGLAPILVKNIFSILKTINEETKMAILLVEQNAKAALSIASHAYVMENGKIVMEGEAEALQENEDVKEFYLGMGQLGERKSYREVKHYKRRKRWIA